MNVDISRYQTSITGHVSVVFFCLWSGEVCGAHTVGTPKKKGREQVGRTKILKLWHKIELTDTNMTQCQMWDWCPIYWNSIGHFGPLRRDFHCSKVDCWRKEGAGKSILIFAHCTIKMSIEEWANIKKKQTRWILFYFAKHRIRWTTNVYLIYSIGKSNWGHTPPKAPFKPGEKKAEGKLKRNLFNVKRKYIEFGTFLFFPIGNQIDVPKWVQQQQQKKLLDRVGEWWPSYSIYVNRNR